MQEIWRPVPIPEFSNKYQVSNLGRIKSLERVVFWGRNRGQAKTIPERILILGTDRYGYNFVYLYSNSKGKFMQVHRLVAKAFIPNPDNKPEIDHINTIRTDNRIQNLRWCTKLENSANPLTKEKQKNAQKGSKNAMWRKYGNLHPRHKKILQIETGNIYYGAGEASRSTGYNRDLIARACRLKQRCGDYHWRYID